MKSAALLFCILLAAVVVLPALAQEPAGNVTLEPAIIHGVTRDVTPEPTTEPTKEITVGPTKERTTEPTREPTTGTDKGTNNGARPESRVDHDHLDAVGCVGIS